jgi:hypothetical protein
MVRAQIVKARYYRIRCIYAGGDAPGDEGVSISEWAFNSLEYGQTSLVGKSVTNHGDAFNPSYPLSNLTDGTIEQSNGSNIAMVAGASAVFDVSVDFGETIAVNQVLIAPQFGNYHRPRNLTCYRSADGATWVTILDLTTIVQDEWIEGEFRAFALTQ